MTYDEIVLACGQLDYRDKLRLSQLLIQTARKEEEIVNPKNRVEEKLPNNDSEQITNDFSEIIERLLKSKPSKKKSLANFIKAMFNFQGGISEEDIEKIILKLQKEKVIKLDQNKVSYIK